MAEFVKLNPSEVKFLHEQNPDLVSYNVEFAEVTGGTFWKAYTPEQIAGTEPFIVRPSAEGIAAMYRDLMQVYPPIDLYNEKLRKLTRDLGTVWCRVSGTWATKTYYDFDGEYPGAAVPEGYLNKLTKEQWIGVLDFVKACNLKLMVSVANCPGLHSAEEPWPSTEAEKLFSFSKAYGVPILAAEFANEPNMLEDTGFPEGYTAAHYRRDADLFAKWLKANYPECLYVGTSDTGGVPVTFGRLGKEMGGSAGGVEQLARNSATCDDLMDGLEVPVDVFSYHYYNGLSDRLASVMPAGHWDASEANGEAYLDTAPKFCRTYIPYRDKYAPGTEMWVTESGDAGGGGNTWASTFMDVFRTLNELGDFASVTDGVIFHNTLASSDYGFLKHGTFVPRPNYFAALLWTRLMGTTVYNSGIALTEGAHVYCHSRKDGKDGCVYLVINNSLTDATTVELPKSAVKYTLAGKDGLRSTVMTLNGRDLVLGEGDELPCLCGEEVSGTIELAPATCTFFVL